MAEYGGLDGPGRLTRNRLLRRAAAAVAGAVGTACAPSGTPGAERPETSRTLQPAELSFWIWALPQLETVRQRAAITTRKHPQIKVGVEVLPNTATYWEKWQAAVAGGVAPDLMWTEPRDFLAWVWKGVWLDLQPFVDADAEFRDIIGGCFRANVGNYLYKCRLGGVPRNAACVAIAYNEDLIAREGLRPPVEIQDTWTWDTLVEYARTLTRREGDQVTQWGYYGGGTGIHAYGSFLYSNGASVFDEGQSWKSNIGSPAAIQTFQYLRDMLLTHRVEPPPDVLAALGGPNPAFHAGKIAMMPLGSWNMKPLNEMASLRYNVARVPMSPTTRKAVSHTIGLAAVVSATTRHRAEAAEVAKNLASVEAQRDVYGEEIPVRPEAAAVWADPKVYPPPNRAVYLQVAKSGQRMPSHPLLNSTQYNPIITNHLNQIYAGQETPAAGLRAAESEINALLANTGSIPAGLEPCARVPGV
jgi:ABC-type glycerol-3-phosphate transport system substrate-binding protein